MAVRVLGKNMQLLESENQQQQGIYLNADSEL